MGFLATLTGVLNSIYIPNIHLMDVIEIAILIFTVYKIITQIVNTRVMVVIQGLLTMFGIYVVSYLLNFSAILVIFENIMTICLFAIVLMFQPDLRKFIESVGSGKTIKIGSLFRSLFKKEDKTPLRYSDRTIDQVVDACTKMGKVKTGALIVWEMDIPLQEYITSGINIGAEISSALLINTFEKDTPLHDGAVVMKGDRLVSATCYLPLTSSEVNKDLGTRHRAAIGASEATDCFVITVSEETGKISFVKGGVIKHGITPEKLKKEMKALQIDTRHQDIKIKNPMKQWRHNLAYKIIAFLVGFLGWIILININNPVYTRTFNDVLIVVENKEVLTSIGKTYELGIEEVDVAITSTRREVERLHIEDVEAVADLRHLAVTNYVDLQVRAPLSDMQATILGDKYIYVDIDELTSKTFKIEPDVKLADDLQGTFTLGDVALTYDEVTITGGKKRIDKISKVVAPATIALPGGLTDFETELAVIDKNGDKMQHHFDLDPDIVHLTARLNNSKEIPVNIEPTEINALDNYSVWKIKYSLEDIRVTGSDGLLSAVNEIVVPLTLDMSAISIIDNEYSLSMDISGYIPEGLLPLDSTIVDITIIFSSFETISLPVSAGDVEVRNTPPDTNISTHLDNGRIVVRAASSDIDGLTVQSLHPYIDLQGKTPGNYTMALSYVNVVGTVQSASHIDVSITSTVVVPDEPVVDTQPPVEDTPVTPPVETPPVEQPPVVQPPVETPPVEDKPVENPPVDTPTEDKPEDVPVVTPEEPETGNKLETGATGNSGETPVTPENTGDLANTNQNTGLVSGTQNNEVSENVNTNKEGLVLQQSPFSVNTLNTNAEYC